MKGDTGDRKKKITRGQEKETRNLKNGGGVTREGLKQGKRKGQCYNSIIISKIFIKK